MKNIFRDVLVCGLVALVTFISITGILLIKFPVQNLIYFH
jgi:hypothetical protein